MCSPDTLDDLNDVLDRLVEADPRAFGDADSVVALPRQLARLEAVATRGTAAFDRSRAWEAERARSAAAWLAARCAVPEATARTRVRVGRALRQLPVAEAAWLAGDIGACSVELLARARNQTTAARLAEDEADLVDLARTASPRTFARAVAYWRSRADADGVEDEARALVDARRVHLSSSFEGTWFLDGVLDPVGGEIVASALARVDDELFRSCLLYTSPSPRDS